MMRCFAKSSSEIGGGAGFWSAPVGAGATVPGCGAGGPVDGDGGTCSGFDGVFCCAEGVPTGAFGLVGAGGNGLPSESEEVRENFPLQVRGPVICRRPSGRQSPWNS